MQCPCTFNLRSHDLGKFRRILLQQDGVRQHASRMDNTFEDPTAFGNFAEDVLKLITATDVGTVHRDMRALRFHPANSASRLLSRFTSSQKNQFPSPTFNQPLRYTDSQPTKSTGNQIRSIGTDR